jgi:hypothetical protein
VKRHERVKLILQALRLLREEEADFAIFEDAQEPDNYVQIANFGGDPGTIVEVTSRDYSDQVLPRLTTQQVDNLVALGFSAETNPNHRGGVRLPRAAVLRPPV